MPDRFGEIAFTSGVKTVQESMGSRRAYAHRELGPDANGSLGEFEVAFITARDSFYLGSVSETGWPYVQFRGGPTGFLRVLDHQTLGFADFRGNRQYITTGNVASNDRVSLFLMDYAARRRLKIFGRMRAVDINDDSALAAKLTLPDYGATVERSMVIAVAAFDWNCPQHITPRFTESEIAAAFGGVREGDTRSCEPTPWP